MFRKRRTRANLSLGCTIIPDLFKQNFYQITHSSIRLMSDYEVTLVNDNSTRFTTPSSYPANRGISVRYMPFYPSPTAHIIRNRQEFYVRFKGPEESQSFSRFVLAGIQLTGSSTIPRRHLEDPRGAPRTIPVQITEHRLRQPNLPP